MMDETPVQVLKEDNRRAKTKTYFWVFRTGEDGLNPIILYNYTPTRAGENSRLLNGINHGFYLMADGYQREWIRIIPISQSRNFLIVKTVRI